MMTEPVTGTAVRKSVTVDAGAEWAFEVFTARMASWWPLDTHAIGKQPAVDATFEPRVGGRLLERAADGSETQWGTVLAWEPPARVVYAWQLTAEWGFDRDVSRASEVEVRFTEIEPGRTRVDLEHRLLERYGERAQEMAGVFSSDGGWTGLLQRFAASAAQH